MSSKRCCVPNCLQTRDAHEVLHLFPNPDKEQHRFNSWIYAIGGEVTSLDHSYVYKHRRVCHAHFEEKYCCRNNRISKISVPTLFLPGKHALIIQKKLLNMMYILTIIILTMVKALFIID